MDRTLESTLLHILKIRLVQDFPGQINACLDVLTEQDLWWRPNEQSNSPANLVLHLAASNRYYVEEIIGGRTVGRDRQAEFAARSGHSKAQIRGTWDESVRVVGEVLNGLEPSQMMQTTDRTGKTTTFAQVLLHVSHHNAAHMGQILWATKELHPGSLDDIGRKTRKQ
ncbi:MAG TPA: DinB family protein [Vicinamibacterales bacterium]